MTTAENVQLENRNSIHYHTNNGKTLVYDLDSVTDYGINLSPVPSETETSVTETYLAEEHVLPTQKTATIIPPKLCHQLPSKIGERLLSCLTSSAEAINSVYAEDIEHSPSSKMLYFDHPSRMQPYTSDYPRNMRSYTEKKTALPYSIGIPDFAEEDEFFNDDESLSDVVDENFAVLEEFATVLEETGSVFDVVDDDRVDDNWSISDDKVRRIVGIVQRHSAMEREKQRIGGDEIDDSTSTFENSDSFDRTETSLDIPRSDEQCIEDNDLSETPASGVLLSMITDYIQLVMSASQELRNSTLDENHGEHNDEHLLPAENDCNDNESFAGETGVQWNHGQDSKTEEQLREIKVVRETEVFNVSKNCQLTIYQPVSEQTDVPTDRNEDETNDELPFWMEKLGTSQRDQDRTRKSSLKKWESSTLKHERTSSSGDELPLSDNQTENIERDFETNVDYVTKDVWQDTEAIVTDFKKQSQNDLENDSCESGCSEDADQLGFQEKNGSDQVGDDEQAQDTSTLELDMHNSCDNFECDDSEVMAQCENVLEHLLCSLDQHDVKLEVSESAISPETKDTANLTSEKNRTEEQELSDPANESIEFDDSNQSQETCNVASSPESNSVDISSSEIFADGAYQRSDSVEEDFEQLENSQSGVATIETAGIASHQKVCHRKKEAQTESGLFTGNISIPSENDKSDEPSSIIKDDQNACAILDVDNSSDSVEDTVSSCKSEQEESEGHTEPFLNCIEYQSRTECEEIQTSTGRESDANSDEDVLMQNGSISLDHDSLADQRDFLPVDEFPNPPRTEKYNLDAPVSSDGHVAEQTVLSTEVEPVDGEELIDVMEHLLCRVCGLSESSEDSESEEEGIVSLQEEPANDSVETVSTATQNIHEMPLDTSCCEDECDNSATSRESLVIEPVGRGFFEETATDQLSDSENSESEDCEQIEEVAIKSSPEAFESILLEDDTRLQKIPKINSKNEDTLGKTEVTNQEELFTNAIGDISTQDGIATDQSRHSPKHVKTTTNETFDRCSADIDDVLGDCSNFHDPSEDNIDVQIAVNSSSENLGATSNNSIPNELQHCFAVCTSKKEDPNEDNHSMVLNQSSCSTVDPEVSSEVPHDNTEIHDKSTAPESTPSNVCDGNLWCDEFEPMLKREDQPLESFTKHPDGDFVKLREDSNISTENLSLEVNESSMISTISLSVDLHQQPSPPSSKLLWNHQENSFDERKVDQDDSIGCDNSNSPFDDSADEVLGVKPPELSQKFIESSANQESNEHEVLPQTSPYEDYLGSTIGDNDSPCEDNVENDFSVNTSEEGIVEEKQSSFHSGNQEDTLSLGSSVVQGDFKIVLFTKLTDLDCTIGSFNEEGLEVSEQPGNGIAVDENADSNNSIEVLGIEDVLAPVNEKLHSSCKTSSRVFEPIYAEELEYALTFSETNNVQNVQLGETLQETPTVALSEQEVLLDVNNDVTNQPFEVENVESISRSREVESRDPEVALLLIELMDNLTENVERELSSQRLETDTRSRGAPNESNDTHYDSSNLRQQLVPEEMTENDNSLETQSLGHFSTLDTITFSDLVPESSNCSVCADVCDNVPTNFAISQETPTAESSLNSSEHPEPSSVLEEVSYFLTTVCVAALTFAAPTESQPPAFNTDIIEDASKYFSNEPEPDNKNVMD